MHTNKREPASGELASSWAEKLWHRAVALEDWIDRMALRLGDAILGEERSEKIFGPHRTHP
jgi:hypothetical protein